MVKLIKFAPIFRKKYLKEKDAIFYAAQVLLAIEYLHNLGLIFRNLRPENILMQANGYIKVANFEFCKVFKPHLLYFLKINIFTKF